MKKIIQFALIILLISIVTNCGVTKDTNSIGKIAKPRFIIQLTDLPKTRTGKIMRRLLKSRILGKPLGDLSSLENPHILNEIQKIN